ncbi:uncharacterized protein [Linepithema humile]|uniref:uncharacterized protein n=1 Tax=Linepithema humile TaxID=83485 RepID=UPI00351ECC90
MSVTYIFPNEILEIIFNFCDVYTLYQLSMVCRQFNIVACDTLNKKSQHLFVSITNQKEKKFYERCKPLLSSYDSIFSTYCNWISASYKKSNIYEEEDMYIEEYYRSNKCLQMTKNTIWFCGDYFLAYNRAKDGTIKKHKKIVGDNYAFIKSIAHCDDYIISGDVDGIIKHWRIESKKDKRNNLKYSVIHDVDEEIDFIDATLQHIIIGSEDLIKILKYTDDKKGCTEEKQIFCGVDVEQPEDDQIYIKSISFDPIGTKFAASFYDYDQSSTSFLIYDIEKNYQVMGKKCEDCCCQLLWEDPHTILMCFEKSIEKMDIRTSKVVRTWDSLKYGLSMCCSSDNRYTFMTGHYECVLWDQRQSDAIQTYTMERDNIKGIIALEFDNTHIYAVKSDDLYELDFTGRHHFDHKEIKKLFGNLY